MQKSKLGNRPIVLLQIFSVLLFGISCYCSMTSLRLMNGDGSRAMLNLLGNVYPYVEGPYFRVANVLLQWPYLIIGNLFSLSIDEARLWIAFSYSTMPLFFLLFYGLESFRIKNSRWIWACIGLICIVYLPQSFNAFNTVVESSFLFLLYLYIEIHWTGFKKNLCSVLLILSFVCSHEVSLAYTGFIVLKPVIDHFLLRKKFTWQLLWMPGLGLIGSIAIVVRYLRIPPVTHIDYKLHLLAYTQNPDLKVMLVFIGLCFFVTLGKKLPIYIMSAVFICLLAYARVDFGWVEFYHYSYRLITPFMTLGWCLLVYYRNSFFDSKIVQVLLLSMFAVYSVRDLKITERWTTALEKFVEYSQDKPACHTSNDQSVLDHLRQYHYFDRVMGMHVSLSMSPSYEAPQLLFLPSPESPDFDPCKYIGENRIPYTEKARFYFHFHKLKKFNWGRFDGFTSR